MKFGEFKQLPYTPDTPMELALVTALYEGRIDVNEVLAAYTRAIEKDRHVRKMRFEEACVCMSQYLCGNWKGKFKRDMQTRMIHIFNRTETLPKNIYNTEYGYTEEDKERWDDLWDLIYGSEL